MKGIGKKVSGEEKREVKREQRGGGPNQSANPKKVTCRAGRKKSAVKKRREESENHDRGGNGVHMGPKKLGNKKEGRGTHRKKKTLKKSTCRKWGPRT